MPGSGEYDKQKDKRWREIFLQWQQSGLSMAAFCRREGLGLSTFCDWRRRIQRRDQDFAEQDRSPLKDEQLSNSASAATASADFAPILLKEQRDVSRNQEHVLSLQLSSGILVLVHEHCSTKFLAQFIHSLEGKLV